MPDPRVQVAIEAIDRTQGAFQQAQRNAEQLSGATVQTGKAAVMAGGQVAQFGRQAASAFGIPVGALGMAGGIGAVALALKASFSAAQEHEQAIRRLDVALANSGTSFAFVRTEIEAVTTALQRKTAVGDEAQMGALVQLVSITGSYTRAIQALPVVLDFAAARQLDLNSAATFVGKALNGQTEMMQRLGVVLKEGATPAEVLTELTRRFAGQAEASATATAKFKDSVHEAAESMGKELKPAMDTGIQVLASFVTLVAEGAAHNIHNVSEMGQAFKTFVLDMTGLNMVLPNFAHSAEEIKTMEQGYLQMADAVAKASVASNVMAAENSKAETALKGMTGAMGAMENAADAMSQGVAGAISKVRDNIQAFAEVLFPAFGGKAPLEGLGAEFDKIDDKLDESVGKVNMMQRAFDDLGFAVHNVDRNLDLYRNGIASTQIVTRRMVEDNLRLINSQERAWQDLQHTIELSQAEAADRVKKIWEDYDRLQASRMTAGGPNMVSPFPTEVLVARRLAAAGQGTIGPSGVTLTDQGTRLFDEWFKRWQAAQNAKTVIRIELDGRVVSERVGLGAEIDEQNRSS